MVDVQPSKGPKKESYFKNKEKVLVVSSRGITFRCETQKHCVKYFKDVDLCA